MSSDSIKEEPGKPDAMPNDSGQFAEAVLQSPQKLGKQDEDQNTTEQTKLLLQSEVPHQNIDGENNTSYPMAESIIVREENSQPVPTDSSPKNPELQEMSLQNQQSMVIQNRAKLNMQQTMIAQEVEERMPEENANHIADNFFYPEDHVDIQREDSPISQNCMIFHDTFGNDSLKRYNLWLIDDQTVTFGAGTGYNFMNFETGQSQIFFSRDRGGIGSICVHPTRKFYGVAEKGITPNVYIYTYPEHKLYRILRKGTEKSYSSCTFSNDGEKIATVGSSPDYQICIWDWKQETILLKAKAFAQEVYRVQFSNYNPNILSTAGMGHIKFWKVAETFTGLKLKGEIAKFGQVELSDVYAFFQFADGKVLSGTEYGRLILWEGNVIKCVIGENADKACHNGQIECVFLDGEYVVSAGADGYIKLWKFSEIDQAEGDDQLNYFMNPSKEILLETEDGGVAHIQSVQRAEHYWIIGDAHGKIWKIDLPDFEKRQIIFRTNSGKLHDLATSPISNNCITAGQDGYVRLWDYVNSKPFYERRFPAEATCVEWVPFTKRNQARVILVGFSNGIVRMLLLKQDGFFLLKALKVISSPITHMRVTADGSLLAVLGKNGHLFLLQIAPQDLQQIEPLCLYETGQQITDMTFDRRGERLLMGNKEGKVFELKVPRVEDVDNSQTYLLNFDPKVWSIKMMENQKPKKEEMDLEFLLRRNKDEKIPEVEWEPAPILNVAYYDNECNRILITADGKFLGNLYIVDWNKERPVDAFFGPKIPSQYMSFQDNNDLLVLGFRNGSYQLRHRSDLRQFVQKESHDMDYGKVRKILLNFDKTAILSVSDDGTLYVYKLDYQGFIQAARGVFIETYQTPELGNGITSGSFNDDIMIDSPIEEDILNDKIYSIQEAKLLAEEDNKRTEADKKKHKTLQAVALLRTQFQQIYQQNLDTDETSKLDSTELCVDPEYVDMLHERVEQDLEETRKELEWEQYFMKIQTDKLKKQMKDELEVDKFAVKGIRQSKNLVYTFKVRSLEQYVAEQLTEIYRLIDEEKRHQAQKESELQVQKTQANDPLKATVQQSMQGQTQQLPNNSGVQQDFQKTDQQQGEGETKISSAKAERERQKQEEEKIRREQEELEKTKPTKESFEPDHLRDIQEANDTLGDYKLKSNRDYIVPKHQIMNVSKKRKHMFLLEEFIYNTKIKFNQQLINLRQRKVELIAKIRSYNETISKINQQLGKQEGLFSPELDKNIEDPDSYMLISDEQIDEWAKSKAKDGQKKQGGFGGMGGGPQTTDFQEKNKPPQNSLQQKQIAQADQLKVRKGIKVQHSELEDEIKVIQEMILQAEKRRMIDEIDEEIAQFDKDVVKCMNEKQVLESDMKIARMKLVTFYQELIILQDMEEYDNKLIKDLLDCKKEKMSLDEQSQKIVENLQNLAKKEQQNEKELNEQMKAFKELVYPDDDHKREKIHQYYLRKYKKDKAKKQKVTNQDDDNDDDEEENDSEEEEEEDDFLDDDDDEKPDISPVENDVKIKEIIDKICELEDNQEMNRKEKMDSERQKVQIANKNVLIQKDLERAEDELRAYQRKKLQRVNQLDVSYMLKLSQIQNMIAQGDSFKLPTDLNTSILFTEQDFYRICKRIRELELEQKKIDRQKKQKEKTKKVFEKEIALKNTKIDDLHKKYEEKHMLKFGDIIDLKILDALEPTKQVIDMRDVFKHEEKEAVKRVEESKKNLQHVKKKLLDAKKENTKIINNITKLGKQQMDLSKKLDSTNKQLFKEENEERRSDLEREKQNLKDLVKFLSKEIEDLKTEIGLFKRKGGHIYTMVTSTKKQFN